MYSIYMEGRGGVFSGENDKICHLPGLEKNPGLKNQKITAQWVLLVFWGVLLEFNGFFWGFFQFESS